MDDPALFFMRAALEEAHRAGEAGEVPVGCVVVRDGEIIARAGNRSLALNDPTAHAEILALRAAAQALSNYRLVGCALYTTLEPCVMCAGAAVVARVETLVYGCDDPKAGAVRSLFRIPEDGRLNHRIRVIPGILAPECAVPLRAFFERLRQVPHNKQLT